MFHKIVINLIENRFDKNFQNENRSTSGNKVNILKNYRPVLLSIYFGGFIPGVFWGIVKASNHITFASGIFLVIAFFLIDYSLYKLFYQHWIFINMWEFWLLIGIFFGGGFLLGNLISNTIDWPRLLLYTFHPIISFGIIKFFRTYKFIWPIQHR